MGMFDNINKIRELKKLTDEINAMEFTSTSKDNKITITVKGDLSVKKIDIDPSLVNEKNLEILKKTIIDTTNKALNEAKNAMRNNTQKLAKDLGINV
ncbi:MAG: YbaB/EbfC family nucleoid-associated protein [Caldisericia bacterium]|nr:YbaB/EbfC family nucleoid-associated protein [Caldisericia bacterium]MDD5688807.1 YbaB/EbfC family nucleoid-associated protein [Caldisericia bacterium]HOJ15589.1 YbaB/EbfC family nucleoid-associated protein [Caldisericia bacterium]HPO28431.1 YbaB/EbfC family nucleoid-associated protein [Caldisericia bacterium]HXK69729.1 YbaB/EbfC family nucleoid-associated protein [Caldisericia bacterium]